jgi:hypothetical protein
MQFPLRSTVEDHLYAFGRHSRHRAFYANLALRGLPRSWARIPFQYVIFHTTYLSAMRWDPSLVDPLLARAAPVKDMDTVRVALPQDEFLRSDTLAAVIEEFRVDHVLSVAQESEWPKIYEKVDRERVQFSRVLTGYLEPSSVRRIDAIAGEVPTRSIDIGYRAWHAAPWLGRHGRIKGDVAEACSERARGRGLAVDISTRDEDTVFGDDWFRFLARSKYTIGVEGGASILDRDGSVKACTEKFLASHPGASFEEVESACFAGRDGELDLRAISPRHLEACATRTCQILVEGAYDGVLKPGVHYLELRADFSNLDEVLATVERDDRRAAITEAAYRDIVASGRFEYAAFVAQIEQTIVGTHASRERRLDLSLRHLLARVRDRVLWGEVALRLKVVPWAQELRAALGRIVRRSA